MGRRNQKKGWADEFGSNDADSTVSCTSSAFSELTFSQETENFDSLEFTLDKYLDALYEKRGSTREKALAGLVSAFEGNVLLDFLEKRCITLLHQYLHSIKRSSSKSKEACLAARAIGLLAITAWSGTNTQEIMVEAIPALSRALVSGPDAVRISVLNCLALVTFVGSNDCEETEKALKIMWEIIHPKPLSKAIPSSAVLIAALSAFSFLLTILTGWRVDLDKWTEMISFLCGLLENNDRAVRIAAGETISIIFEIVVAGKLSSVTEDMASKPKWLRNLLSLREKIILVVSDLAMEAGGKGIDKKNMNMQRDMFRKIYDYLKKGQHPEASLKISKQQRVLTTSTWSELIQLNFIKDFLGGGFLKHAQENELLHNLFDLMPEAEKGLSASEKRNFRSSVDRERTLALKKERQKAENKKVLLFSDED